MKPYIRVARIHDNNLGLPPHPLSHRMSGSFVAKPKTRLRESRLKDQSSERTLDGGVEDASLVDFPAPQQSAHMPVRVSIPNESSTENSRPRGVLKVLDVT